MMKVQPRPNDDTAPCVGCGLCCDGTLYVRAQVTPGEEPRMTEYGLELITHENKPFFLQPCPHQSCGRCTIYGERFDICHSFSCALLRRYHAGEIDLAEARKVIEGAMQLLEKVRTDYPSAGQYLERSRLRRALADELDKADPSERGPIARQLLKLVSTDVYLDRWFRDEKDQAGSPEETSGSNSARKTPRDRAQSKPPRKII